MVGYVVMPEHVHVLIGETDDDTPSVVMQVLKHVSCANSCVGFASEVRPGPGSLWSAVLEEGHVWQCRFY